MLTYSVREATLATISDFTQEEVEPQQNYPREKSTLVNESFLEKEVQTTL